MAEKGLKVFGEVSRSQVSRQQQQEHSTVGQVAWEHYIPWLSIVGHSGHVFRSSRAWMLGESHPSNLLSV